MPWGAAETLRGEADVYVSPRKESEKHIELLQNISVLFHTLACTHIYMENMQNVTVPETPVETKLSGE